MLSVNWENGNDRMVIWHLHQSVCQLRRDWQRCRTGDGVHTSVEKSKTSWGEQNNRQQMATKIKTRMLFDPAVLLVAAPTAAFTHVWDHAWSHSLQPYSWAEKLDITYVCLHKPRAKHTTSSPTGYHTPTEKERSTNIYGRNLRVVTPM